MRVKVIPKSPKSEIVGEMDDGTMKIRIKAAPEKGKANKELIRFLSGEMGIPKENIQIISGAFDQIKLLKIHGPNK